MVELYLFEEILSCKEYLSLSKKEKLNIKSSETIPAKLGKGGFGSILVKYKTPVCKLNNLEA